MTKFGQRTQLSTLMLIPPRYVCSLQKNPPIKLPEMEKYNEEKAKQFSVKKPGPRNLFKMSWTLTPNEYTIFEMILPGTAPHSVRSMLLGYPHTLLQLADIANKDLVKWFEDKIKPSQYSYPILGNILIIDHYDVSAVVDIVTRR